MKESILEIIRRKAGKGKKQLAVLIDPDKFNPEVVANAEKTKVDFIFIGGSTVKKSDFYKAAGYIKKNSKIPLVIFPGDEHQISKKADALLLLSLVSGRNSDYLIGKHVSVAKQLKQSKIEIIPTAYILLDGGKKSTVSKVTKTIPIEPKNKNLIISTSIASELLGLKLIYLEAGSGAKISISGEVLRSVKNHINLPIICGGGIDSKDKIEYCWLNGADLVVVGNALEKKPELLFDLVKAREKYSV
ncbi:MAG: geranylgeranylglyceryl/heptaprenylglyceryl phosphate synthase [Bacteroidota bacterium]|jgi:phosphoglycerol geranylgeranyltransferase